MAKLNQLIALTDAAKTRTREAVTGCYHKLQQTQAMEGLSRVYRPKDEEGDIMPPETKIVQLRATDVIEDGLKAYQELWELVLGLDDANTQAKADIVVDGRVLAVGVPVTSLLFLRKQLVDLRTMVVKIPVLDPSYEWEYSSETDCFATKPTESTRTKKVPRNHVKAEATANHPAQVDVYPEDVTVGFWTKIDYSGAMAAKEKADLLERVEKLQDAVNVAREEANGLAVEKKVRTKGILNYIKGDNSPLT